MVCFFSSRRRHTRWPRDWSSDVGSSDLLAAEPIGHLNGPELLAQRGSAPEDAATKQSAARNAKALDDFLDADVIVIGAPMYNFSLPSQLKAWLDRVAVAGKTFRYTANGV